MSAFFHAFSAAPVGRFQYINRYQKLSQGFGSEQIVFSPAIQYNKVNFSASGQNQ